ncbi:MAG: hypothetical protein FJ278_08835 [Planctomycetes bacterium]|nr:hypothetical protein [Planctomycetota bacterium]
MRLVSGLDQSANALLEFGCEVAFTGLKADADGAVGWAAPTESAARFYFTIGKFFRAVQGAERAITAAPYFQVAQGQGEADPLATLSHFLIRRFPGHEWNHFALFALQACPIEVARSVAYSLLSGEPSAPEVAVSPADEHVWRQSASHLARLRPAYANTFGKETATQLLTASERLLDRHSVLAEARCLDATPIQDRKSKIQNGPSSAALDATFLHLSFTAESLTAALDVLLLHALGEPPDRFLLERAATNPLLQRLLRLRPSKAVDFILTWHAQRYRFPPFTARFIHTFAQLPIRREHRGQV